MLPPPPRIACVFHRMEGYEVTGNTANAQLVGVVEGRHLRRRLRRNRKGTHSLPLSARSLFIRWRRRPPVSPPRSSEQSRI